MPRIPKIVVPSLNGQQLAERYPSLTLPTPEFSAGEVARVFFGRDLHWLQNHERKGHLTLDGEPLVIRRAPPGPKAAKKGQGGHRVFSLAEVEQLAHALAQGGFIDPVNLTAALLAVFAQGLVWGRIEPS